VSRLSHLPITPVIVCAALLALTYFGFSTWQYVTHNYRLSEEETQVRRDIARLERERAQLVAVRDYLESDEYVEYVARSVLGLVRPGETLVIVSSSAPPAPTPTPGTGEPDDGAKPWWQELFVEPAAAPTPE
jgi:cell division protein FtsB